MMVYLVSASWDNSCSSICSIAECFAFLVCTKWYNPAIHRQSQIRESCSSSMTFRYVDWNRGLVVSSDEDQHQSGMCNLQDIGGHVMKIPFIGFQILLFMRLEVWMLKTLSYEYIWKFFKLYSLIYITIFSFLFFPREHHLVLGICHFQSFLLLFFCCKELGSYLLHIDWWRKLFFYCIVKLALGHILL